MNEINRIKKAVSIAKTDFRAQLAFGGEVVISKLDIAALITAVESNNAEIERLQGIIDDMEMQGIIDIEQDELYRG